MRSWVLELIEQTIKLFGWIADVLAARGKSGNSRPASTQKITGKAWE